MSVQATTWVWEHSTSTGSQRLVLLAVADAANREGGESCQSVATLVRMTGCGESTVHRALKALQQAEELVSDGINPRYAGAVVYRLPGVMAGGPILAPPQGGPISAVGGSQSGSEGVPNRDPTPKSITPTDTPPPLNAGQPPVVLALVASGTEPEPALFASSEVEKREPDWPPEATQNACRQVWLAEWTETHGAPDLTLKARAFGQIKAAAKGRESLEDWRRLWWACQAAGKAGVWNVSSFLAPAPVSRFPERTNHYLALAEQAAQDGLLDDMISWNTRPAIGGPA